MQQATLSHRPIDFKKERNFSQKLNATFEFLSQNIKPIGKNLLLTAGPFILLAGICLAVLPIYLLNSSMTGPSPLELPSVQPLFVVAICGVFLFSLLAGTLVITVTLFYIRKYVEEGTTNISTGQLWKSIWKDFFNVFGTSIFISIAFLLSWWGLTLLMALIIAGFSQPAVAFFVFAITTIGGFCIYSALLLLYPIRTIEKKNVFSATSRMLKLNAGKWLSTAGLILVVIVIQTVASFAFATPMYIFTFIRTFHMQDQSVVQSSPVYSILYSLTFALFIAGCFAMSSLIFIAITFQYYNLVERKEAAGLLERLESFGAQQTDPHDEDEHY